jgi:hypothetical protein
LALAVLDLKKAIEFSQSDMSRGEYSEDELALLRELDFRRNILWPEQSAFAQACDRWDSLYYPPTEAVLPGKGASHWWYHSSAKLPGKAHVSVNTPPIYVDIPAALQAVTPVENVTPAREDPQSRQLAAMVERLYYAWKEDQDFDLIGHKGCIVKGLYGRTAGKVWWDPETNFPKVSIIDQPRNLWLGWGQSDYKTLDWAAYTYTMTPEAIYAEYGLVTTQRQGQDGNTYPYLMSGNMFATWHEARQAMWYAAGEIEVTDYWYRQPVQQRVYKGKAVRAVKHATWNAIVVGNRVVQNQKFSEYDGLIPFVPLFNSYIPGVPNGRPELFDIEQLIREKDERISSGSQLMHNIVNAQYWQLVGPDSPDAVPAGLKPKPQQVIAPGAGNRVEKIEPWMPEFQLEQFLTRIDRELVDVSGLNDLLRGMAPSSVMSSSKAINALVANYETRISMKRDIYYRWRRDMWAMAVRVWKNKSSDLRPLFEAASRLQVISPSLTPRDDMEAAQIARTLVDGKLWSGVRGMDRVGVDDPEAEQDVIRAEQTDVALNPAAVQVISAVAMQLQSMGMQNAQQALGAMGGQPGPGENPEEQGAEGGPSQGETMADMRGEMGGGEGAGVAGSGEGPMPAAEAMPGNTPEGQAAGAGPMMEPGAQMMNQTMIKGGEPSNRLMLQQQIGQNPAQEG